MQGGACHKGSPGGLACARMRSCVHYALPCAYALQKHIDDIPELKAEKMAMNRRTLRAMQVCVWGVCVGGGASSGGTHGAMLRWLPQPTRLL